MKPAFGRLLSKGERRSELHCAVRWLQAHRYRKWGSRSLCRVVSCRWGCISGSATRQGREAILPLLWYLRNCVCSTTSSSGHPGTKKPSRKQPPNPEAPNPLAAGVSLADGHQCGLGLKQHSEEEVHSNFVRSSLTFTFLLPSGCRGDRACLFWVVSSGRMRGTNSNKGNSY